MPNSVTSAIASLSNSDAEVRALAASEIYRQGRAQADRAVLPWFQNKELAGLLLSPEPIVTVGLAVARETFERIHKANGEPELARVPPDQDAEEFELHFEAGVQVDVLTSKDPAGSGAIARYLSRFGEGTQQVEFYCRDVNRATTILREHFGVTAIYEEWRPGAGGTRINFFLVAVPEAAEGNSKILIELYESPHTAVSPHAKAR